MSREEKINLLVSLIESMKPEDRNTTISLIQKTVKMNQGEKQNG